MGKLKFPSIWCSAASGILKKVSLGSQAAKSETYIWSKIPKGNTETAFGWFFPHSSLSVQCFCPFLNAFSQGHHHVCWRAQLCLAGGPGHQNLLLKVYSQVLSKDNGMCQVFKLRLPELHPPQTCHIAFESLHRIELFNKLILMSNIVSVLWNIVEQHFKKVVYKGVICTHIQTVSMLFCSVLRIHKTF